jgi:predicted ATPase
MNYSNFSRGSEWRKWDLHIHTPFSILNNGFGNDWDIYVQKMFKKAIEHDIWAIGITDYFSIDGYKKIRTEYLENPVKMEQLFSKEEIERINKILLLPNIEFRLDKLVNDNRVNFHVIFSDKASISDIEENFLHEIDFVYEGNPQSIDEKWKLKIKNIERLGERLIEEHSKFKDYSPLYVGMMNAVVSDNQICKILNEKPTLFESQYLIALPSDEDLSKVNWDSQAHHTRKVLIQKSDCFFASNPKTINWGLGNTYDEKSAFVKEFKSVKPCIWGSDAHSFDELFEKNIDRPLWIKADLTFNGLYQIKFEPAERVVIQPTKPEEKRPYFLINNVSFLDSRTFPKFSSEEILINQNLTAIIGGKSTGKSLLLYHIAKAIDPQQVSEKINQLDNPNLIYDFEKDSDFDFKVKWKDDGENKLQDNTETSSKRQITYIPQHYLSSLSKNKNLDDKKSLNNFIRETLLSDGNSRKQEEKTKETSHEKLKFISSLINDFFGYFDDITSQRQNLKEKGDKSGILKYIEQLKAEIESLRKQSTLSEKQSKVLQELTNEEEKLQKELSGIVSDIESVNSFKNKSNDLVQRLKSIKEEHQNYLNTDFVTTEFNKAFKFISVIEKLFNDGIDSLTKPEGVILKRIEEIKAKISEIKLKLEPLLSNIKQQEILQTKIKQLKEEEEKIRQIEIQEKLLNEKQKSLKTSFDKIFVEYEQIYTSYKSYQEALLKAKEDLKEVQINVKLAFNNEKFSEQVKSHIQKIDLRKQYDSLKNNENEFFYEFQNFEHYISTLKDILKNVINGKLKTYKSISAKEIFSVLIEDFFFLDYFVSYKNDSLEKMSPGKRNLVLLKIIIEKNNQQWPILIDQPEDDLDNRSVYNDLVSFLKEKKKQRQIIIVTHNPNAVVGADAEEVTVANQSGQDTDRTNEVYDFEYVTGSLEHSIKKGDSQKIILQSMGIREHVCDILEGGEDAFKKREEKYGF